MVNVESVVCGADELVALDDVGTLVEELDGACVVDVDDEVVVVGDWVLLLLPLGGAIDDVGVG